MPIRILPIAVAILTLLGVIGAQEKTLQESSTPATQSRSDNPADKPRVFITDSQSWEMAGAGGGGNGAGAGAFSGGARPQTAEIIKTFDERCPNVVVNNKQNIVDYIVVLDHEGGKGVLRHRNKVAVFERRSGDSIVSHSTLSLGGSVQDACEAITKHWNEHGTQLRAADAATPPEAAPREVLAAAELKPSAKTKVNITSNPDGADIEVDGAFVGNAPSVVELDPGSHTISLKKNGFKPWERKLKVTGGQVNVNGALEPSS